MPPVNIASNHPAIRRYRHELDTVQRRGIMHEGGLRHAFATLLRDTGRECDWTLDEEVTITALDSDGTIRLDGLMRNEYLIPRGYWEAKGPNDNLDAEIDKKRRQGYPLSNIIFENTIRVVLIQDGQVKQRAETRKPVQVGKLLTRFYNHEYEFLPDIDDAIAQFRIEIPQFADALLRKIHDARLVNPPFQQAFSSFFRHCSSALDPNITRDSVDEMLVQHILTGRIIHDSFDSGFSRHNAIAIEVEGVIDSLAGQHFDLDDFLGPLNRIYMSIGNAAKRLTDFGEKQTLLDKVYEGFFQGWSVKNADRLGIVYTPQEVVDFMCAATDELLQREFGKKFGDEGVEVIDPCTGTGNFAVNLVRHVARHNKNALAEFYEKRLFANEIMLMAYYIASLNIEREYHRRRLVEFSRFEGLSFVDTLGLEDEEKSGDLNEESRARINRQRSAPINVVIGNPPYNSGQQNENENNKNRDYPHIDARIKETYSAGSTASLKRHTYDAYKKFFRWASDRLESRDGIVCFITNNNFVDGKASDGFRKHLLEEFTRVWHLDLAGDFRGKKGGGESIFGNLTGVSVGITFALRKAEHFSSELRYYRVPDNWSASAKKEFLVECFSDHESVLDAVGWELLMPDVNHDWFPPEHSDTFSSLLPLGAKRVSTRIPPDIETIFRFKSLGSSSNRDEVVFGFDTHSLGVCVEEFVRKYNTEVVRYEQFGELQSVDDFVNYDLLKWSSTLKNHLKRGRAAGYSIDRIRTSFYRPFAKRYLFFDKILIDRRSQFPLIFPTQEAEQENLAICVSGVASRKPFQAMAVDTIPCLDMLEKTQCFPLYTYDADGSNRRENVTDWAQATFRERYGDAGISKLDIFHYVYGLLHHPGYRERHADSLRRELPRIPVAHDGSPSLAPDFAAFRDAGRDLARLHLNYERVDPWGLDWEVGDAPIDWRVEKMRPLKRVQSEDGDYKIFDSLQYNDTLTLRGIPADAFRYRLGTRSALEWVVDQYRVKTDKRSGIVSDPNAWSDDQQYIVNLVGRVLRVSMETVKIVDDLAGLSLVEG